jgi:hypothetical protein
MGYGRNAPYPNHGFNEVISTGTHSEAHVCLGAHSIDVSLRVMALAPRGIQTWPGK